MKALSWISILFAIVASKTNASFTRLRIDDVAIDFNGEEIRSRESFGRQYGYDVLAVASLASNRVPNAKSHLATVIEILPDNALRARFEYVSALVDRYSELRRLGAITKNIYNFFTENGGVSTSNSFVSFDGVTWTSTSITNSSSSADRAKTFVADSIRADNEDEIKSYFEEHERAMKRAAQKRATRLARAAKIRRESEERRRKILDKFGVYLGAYK